MSVQRMVPSVFGILSWIGPEQLTFFREIKILFSASIDPPPSKAAFLFLDQNLALSGVIGLADDAFEFHPLHQ